MLSPDLQTCVSIASGWFESGDWSRAEEELERLPLEEHYAAPVLILRCLIYGRAAKWERVEAVAQSGAEAYPDEQRFYVHSAWAKHRLGKTEEGLQIARGAVWRFPTSGIVAYTMACLNGALGREEEARAWLRAAFERALERNRLEQRARRQRELHFLWKDSEEV